MKSKGAYALALPVVLSVLLGCRPGGPPVAEVPLDDGLRQLAEAFFANRDFSGVVAVSRDGELIGEAAVGFADAEKARAPDLHTSFHVASISKTFTAAAIRALLSQDRLALNDPIARFLPDFPKASAITIRHLLDHQSGVPDYWSLAEVNEYASRRTSIDELVAWLGTKPLDFEPGSSNSYSNSGYALLAAVVEAASETDYHDYLIHYVFPAAGLEETSAFEQDADATGFVPSYAADRIGPSAPYDASILIGAGSIKSTAADLLSWCDAFIADFVDDTSPVFVHGWGVRKENGRRRAEQTGRNPGFSAHLRAYPDSRTCVVVLSNIESDSVTTLGAGASAIAFGEKTTAPAARPLISVPQSKLAALVGRFQISPGRTVETSLGANGLLLRGQNGPFLPLESIGQDKFFYRQLYTTVEAERDESGLVTALLWGGSYRLPRVE